MKHIVVTGATSFVGAGAVRELLRRGNHVSAVLRRNSAKAHLLMDQGRRPENLTILEADLGELDALSDRLKGHCDVFLHMGWRGAGSDSRRSEEVQRESVRDALSAVGAARALGCTRFLFTGSQAEYGLHSGLMGEDLVCRPTSPYGAAKLEVLTRAEKLCRDGGLDYGHVRIFSVYGPGDHPWSLVSSCTSAFLQGGHMELSACTQLWNFLYIDDAGRALADLAEYEGRLSDHGCVYNLGGPMEETGPLKYFVEQIYELCGRKGSFTYGLRSPNAEGTVSLSPDIRKLEKVVGWTPKIRFEQGICNILRKL